jgi:hypothetical protein
MTKPIGKEKKIEKDLPFLKPFISQAEDFYKKMIKKGRYEKSKK